MFLHLLTISSYHAAIVLISIISQEEIKHMIFNQNLSVIIIKKDRKKRKEKDIGKRQIWSSP